MNFAGSRADGSRPLRDTQRRELGSVFFGQSSFATYALSPAVNAVKVRKDAPLELLGPLACGLSTGAGVVLNVLKPGPDAVLAVLGAGALGLAAVMAANHLGCKRIVAVDRFESRLALARSLGATEAIDTSVQPLAESLTAARPIDFVIDTTGVPKVIESALAALRTRGTCVLLGASHNSDLHVNIMHMISGRTVMGVINGDPDQQVFIPHLVDLFMSGKFPIDRLSRFYPLGQINEAVADSRSGKTIKPILRMPV
jgi:aryl-alcohol dehydrogenase